MWHFAIVLKNEDGEMSQEQQSAFRRLAMKEHRFMESGREGLDGDEREQLQLLRTLQLECTKPFATYIGGLAQKLVDTGKLQVGIVQVGERRQLSKVELADGDFKSAMEAAEAAKARSELSAARALRLAAGARKPAKRRMSNLPSRERAPTAAGRQSLLAHDKANERELMVALAEGEYVAARELLEGCQAKGELDRDEARSPVMAVDEKGRCAIHQLYNGEAETAEDEAAQDECLLLLLMGRAPVSHVSDNGRTALMAAASVFGDAEPNTKAINLLVGEGAEVRAVDTRGWSCADWAMYTASSNFAGDESVMSAASEEHLQALLDMGAGLDSHHVVMHRAAKGLPMSADEEERKAAYAEAVRDSLGAAVKWEECHGMAPADDGVEAESVAAHKRWGELKAQVKHDVLAGGDELVAAITMQSLCRPRLLTGMTVFNREVRAAVGAELAAGKNLLGGVDKDVLRREIQIRWDGMASEARKGVERDVRKMDSHDKAEAGWAQDEEGVEGEIARRISLSGETMDRQSPYRLRAAKEKEERYGKRDTLGLGGYKAFYKAQLQQGWNKRKQAFSNSICEYDDGIQRAVVLVRMRQKALVEEWTRSMKERWIEHAHGLEPGGDVADAEKRARFYQTGARDKSQEIFSLDLPDIDGYEPGEGGLNGAEPDGEDDDGEDDSTLRMSLPTPRVWTPGALDVTPAGVLVVVEELLLRELKSDVPLPASATETQCRLSVCQCERGKGHHWQQHGHVTCPACHGCLAIGGSAADPKGFEAFNAKEGAPSKGALVYPPLLKRRGDGSTAALELMPFHGSDKVGRVIDPIDQVFPLKDRQWNDVFLYEFTKDHDLVSNVADVVKEQMKDLEGATARLPGEGQSERWGHLKKSTIRAVSIESVILLCEIMLWFSGNLVGGEKEQYYLVGAGWLSTGFVLVQPQKLINAIKLHLSETTHKLEEATAMAKGAAAKGAAVHAAVADRVRSSSPTSDETGDCNAYVTVTACGEEQETPWKRKNDTCPRWLRSEAMFSFRQPRGEVRVEVHDKDITTKDDFLGRVVIDCADLDPEAMRTTGIDRWYELDMGGVEGAELAAAAKGYVAPTVQLELCVRSQTGQLSVYVKGCANLHDDNESSMLEHLDTVAEAIGDLHDDAVWYDPLLWLIKSVCLFSGISCFLLGASDVLGTSIAISCLVIYVELRVIEDKPPDSQNGGFDFEPGAFTALLLALTLGGSTYWYMYAVSAVPAVRWYLLGFLVLMLAVVVATEVYSGNGGTDVEGVQRMAVCFGDRKAQPESMHKALGMALLLAAIGSVTFAEMQHADALLVTHAQDYEFRGPMCIHPDGQDAANPWASAAICSCEASGIFGGLWSCELLGKDGESSWNSTSDMPKLSPGKYTGSKCVNHTQSSYHADVDAGVDASTCFATRDITAKELHYDADGAIEKEKELKVHTFRVDSEPFAHTTSTVLLVLAVLFYLYDQVTSTSLFGKNSANLVTFGCSAVWIVLAFNMLRLSQFDSCTRCDLECRQKMFEEAIVKNINTTTGRGSRDGVGDGLEPWRANSVLYESAFSLWRVDDSLLKVFEDNNCGDDKKCDLTGKTEAEACSVLGRPVDCFTVKNMPFFNNDGTGEFPKNRTDALTGVRIFDSDPGTYKDDEMKTLTAKVVTWRDYDCDDTDDTSTVEDYDPRLSTYWFVPCKPQSKEEEYHKDYDDLTCHEYLKSNPGEPGVAYPRPIVSDAANNFNTHLRRFIEGRDESDPLYYTPWHLEEVDEVVRLFDANCRTDACRKRKPMGKEVSVKKGTPTWFATSQIFTWVEQNPDQPEMEPKWRGFCETSQQYNSLHKYFFGTGEFGYYSPIPEFDSYSTLLVVLVLGALKFAVRFSCLYGFSNFFDFLRTGFAESAVMDEVMKASQAVGVEDADEPNGAALTEDETEEERMAKVDSQRLAVKGVPVGGQVAVRNDVRRSGGKSEWLFGTITSLDPLLVHVPGPDSVPTGRPWDEVRKLSAQETSKEEASLFSLPRNLLLSSIDSVLNRESALILRLHRMYGLEAGSYFAFVSFYTSALFVPSGMAVFILFFTWWLPNIPLQDPLMLQGKMVKAGAAQYGANWECIADPRKYNTGVRQDSTSLGIHQFNTSGHHDISAFWDPLMHDGTATDREGLTSAEVERNALELRAKQSAPGFHFDDAKAKDWYRIYNVSTKTNVCGNCTGLHGANETSEPCWDGCEAGFRRSCPRDFPGCSRHNQCDACDESCGVGGKCQTHGMDESHKESNIGWKCGAAYCMTCPDPERGQNVPLAYAANHKTTTHHVDDVDDYAKQLFSDGAGCCACKGVLSQRRTCGDDMADIKGMNANGSGTTATFMRELQFNHDTYLRFTGVLGFLMSAVWAPALLASWRQVSLGLQNRWNEQSPSIAALEDMRNPTRNEGGLREVLFVAVPGLKKVWGVGTALVGTVVIIVAALSIFSGYALLTQFEVRIMMLRTCDARCHAVGPLDSPKDLILSSSGAKLTTAKVKYDAYYGNYSKDATDDKPMTRLGADNAFSVNTYSELRRLHEPHSPYQHAACFARKDDSSWVRKSFPPARFPENCGFNSTYKEGLRKTKATNDCTGITSDKKSLGAGHPYFCNHFADTNDMVGYTCDTHPEQIDDDTAKWRLPDSLDRFNVSLRANEGCFVTVKNGSTVSLLGFAEDIEVTLRADAKKKICLDGQQVAEDSAGATPCVVNKKGTYETTVTCQTYNVNSSAGEWEFNSAAPFLGNAEPNKATDDPMVGPTGTYGKQWGWSHEELCVRAQCEYIPATLDSNGHPMPADIDLCKQNVKRYGCNIQTKEDCLDHGWTWFGEGALRPDSKRRVQATCGEWLAAIQKRTAHKRWVTVPNEADYYNNLPPRMGWDVAKLRRDYVLLGDGTVEAAEECRDVCTTNPEETETAHYNVDRLLRMVLRVVGCVLGWIIASAVWNVGDHFLQRVPGAKVRDTHVTLELQHKSTKRQWAALREGRYGMSFAFWTLALVLVPLCAWAVPNFLMDMLTDASPDYAAAGRFGGSGSWTLFIGRGDQNIVDNLFDFFNSTLQGYRVTPKAVSNMLKHENALFYAWGTTDTSNVAEACYDTCTKLSGVPLPIGGRGFDMILIGILVAIVIEVVSVGIITATLTEYVLREANFETMNVLNNQNARVEYAFVFITNFSYFLILGLFYVPFGEATAERIQNWAHAPCDNSLAMWDYVQHPWLAVIGATKDTSSCDAGNYNPDEPDSHGWVKYLFMSKWQNGFLALDTIFLVPFFVAPLISIVVETYSPKIASWMENATSKKDDRRRLLTQAKLLLWLVVWLSFALYSHHYFAADRSEKTRKAVIFLVLWTAAGAGWMLQRRGAFEKVPLLCGLHSDELSLEKLDAQIREKQYLQTELHIFLRTHGVEPEHERRLQALDKEHRPTEVHHLHHGSTTSIEPPATEAELEEQLEAMQEQMFDGMHHRRITSIKSKMRESWKKHQHHGGCNLKHVGIKGAKANELRAHAMSAMTHGKKYDMKAIDEEEEEGALGAGGSRLQRAAATTNVLRTWTSRMELVTDEQAEAVGFEQVRWMRRLPKGRGGSTESVWKAYHPSMSEKLERTFRKVVAGGRFTRCDNCHGHYEDSVKASGDAGCDVCADSGLMLTKVKDRGYERRFDFVGSSKVTTKDDDDDADDGPPPPPRCACACRLPRPLAAPQDLADGTNAFREVRRDLAGLASGGIDGEGDGSHEYKKFGLAEDVDRPDEESRSRVLKVKRSSSVWRQVIEESKVSVLQIAPHSNPAARGPGAGPDARRLSAARADRPAQRLHEHDGALRQGHDVHHLLPDRARAGAAHELDRDQGRRGAHPQVRAAHRAAPPELREGHRAVVLDHGLPDLRKHPDLELLLRLLHGGARGGLLQPAGRHDAQLRQRLPRDQHARCALLLLCMCLCVLVLVLVLVRVRVRVRVLVLVPLPLPLPPLASLRTSHPLPPSECCTIGHTMAPNPDCFRGSYFRVMVSVLLEHIGLLIAFVTFTGVCKAWPGQQTQSTLIQVAKRGRRLIWEEDVVKVQLAGLKEKTD